MYASLSDLCEVCIFFNNHLLRGNRSTKVWESTPIPPHLGSKHTVFPQNWGQAAVPCDEFSMLTLGGADVIIGSPENGAAIALVPQYSIRDLAAFTSLNFPPLGVLGVHMTLKKARLLPPPKVSLLRVRYLHRLHAQARIRPRGCTI
jgi:hypothetical protein